MRRYLVLLLVLSAVAPALAPAAGSDEVRRVLLAQVAAWNRGDVGEFLAGYDNSPGTIFVGATVIHGLDAVRARYKTRYPTRASMGKLEFSLLDIRVLDAAYASVIGQWRLDREAASGGPKGGYFTLLLHKTPAGWKIVVDHTS